jgi:HEAT repeat protein
LAPDEVEKAQAQAPAVREPLKRPRSGLLLACLAAALFLAACVMLGANLTRLRVWHHMRYGSPVESDPADGLKAITALVSMGRPAVPVIQEYLSSEDDGKVSLAAESLSRIGDVQALPAMVKAYSRVKQYRRSPTDTFVMEGICRLCRNASPEGTIKLEELRRHPSEDIRQAAAEALKKLRPANRPLIRVKWTPARKQGSTSR